jgi:hypothetical protein
MVVNLGIRNIMNSSNTLRYYSCVDYQKSPAYQDFRDRDARSSQADIYKAK